VITDLIRIFLVSSSSFAAALIRRNSPPHKKMNTQLMVMKKQVAQLRQESNAQRIPVSIACEE
jgi:hypothetical protein